MRLSIRLFLLAGTAELLATRPALATEGYFADGYGTQSKGEAGAG